jgi:hypothetical protein
VEDTYGIFFGLNHRIMPTWSPNSLLIKLVALSFLRL